MLAATRTVMWSLLCFPPVCFLPFKLRDFLARSLKKRHFIHIEDVAELIICKDIFVSAAVSECQHFYLPEHFQMLCCGKQGCGAS